jgi:hypothetical protein
MPDFRKHGLSLDDLNWPRSAFLLPMAICLHSPELRGSRGVGNPPFAARSSNFAALAPTPPPPGSMRRWPWTLTHLGQ